MSETKIKNVVFDVGEVLIDWNPRYLYSQVFDEEEEMEYFLKEICTNEWNYRQDMGYSWDDAIAEKCAEFPDYAPQIKLYRRYWPEMVKGGVQGSVDVLHELKKKKIPVYAITNYNDETFKLSQELWPFLTEFDGVVVSGEEKICKPDPRIYQILFDRYNLAPETCVFIDDRAENIEAAKAQNMQGILFENPLQMRGDLEALIGKL